MVYAPTAYDGVRVSGDAFRVIPEIRNGLGTLIDLQSEKHAAAQAVVEFLQGAATVLHRCRVAAIPYDPDLQDLTKLQVGDCTLTQTAGLPHLYAGHQQIWKSPNRLKIL